MLNLLTDIAILTGRFPSGANVDFLILSSAAESRLEDGNRRYSGT